MVNTWKFSGVVRGGVIKSKDHNKFSPNEYNVQYIYIYIQLITPAKKKNTDWLIGTFKFAVFSILIDSCFLFMSFLLLYALQ